MSQKDFEISKILQNLGMKSESRHSAVYEKHHITSEENSEMKFRLMYRFP